MTRFAAFPLHDPITHAAGSCSARCLTLPVTTTLLREHSAHAAVQKMNQTPGIAPSPIHLELCRFELEICSSLAGR
ncbi:unnamed protein product [Mycena citricolor]|uniref:Uncharacterized protein n=1 Tax=Mycena citricolor TaxID=2018698 RepID=A0AAD2HXA9_9AGAR|nr:unnamed protein product [Mycena citricolor]